MTTRLSEPSLSAAYPSFTSRSEILFETRSSRFIRPCRYSSAYIGMSRLALVEPKFTPWTRFFPPDRAKDVHPELDIGCRHPDQVKSAADSEHCQSLFSN